MLHQQRGVLKMLHKGFPFLAILLDSGEGVGVLAHGLAKSVSAVVFQPLWIGQSAMCLCQLPGVLNVRGEGFTFLAVLLDSGEGVGTLAHNGCESAVAVVF